MITGTRALAIAAIGFGLTAAGTAAEHRPGIVARYFPTPEPITQCAEIVEGEGEWVISRSQDNLHIPLQTDGDPLPEDWLGCKVTIVR